MNAWLPGLLTWGQAYSYPAVGIVLFIAAVGAPLPVTLFLLAAGAFSAAGNSNILLLTLIAISGSVAGDQLGYSIGRWGGRRLLNWLKRSPCWRFLLARVVAPAEAYCARRGSWAIFLSRFLLSGLGGAINLLAGANHFPYLRFLQADTAGETLGVLIPLSLGYVFGARWEAAGIVLNTASLYALGVVVVLALFISLARTARRTSRYRARAHRGLQVQRLCERHSSGSKTVCKRLTYKIGGAGGIEHRWTG